jgi:hypothetical protein
VFDRGRRNVQTPGRDGSFQAGTCPTCGAPFRLGPAFNCLDMERGKWISAQPLDDLADWSTREAKAKETFRLAYGDGAPALARIFSDSLSVRGTVQFSGVHNLSNRVLLTANCCSGEAECAGKSVLKGPVVRSLLSVMGLCFASPWKLALQRTLETYVEVAYITGRRFRRRPCSVFTTPRARSTSATRPG